MKVNHKNAGQTLLEMVIAFLVATLVIIALATVTIRAIKNAQISENRTKAARFAQQAIEQVRAVRDQQGWTAFSSYANGCYQVNTSSSLWTLTAVSCGGELISGTIFRRQISLTDDGANGKNVNVTITWTDASGNQQTVIDTKLTKWQ